MPRKNGNAGQSNRQAQMQRRFERREENEKHKSVLGPGSKNLRPVPAKVKEGVA